MKINIEGQFILNQSLHSNGFDLIKKVTRTKKESGEKYEAESVLGYDMKLEKAIETIISERMKDKEDTVELNEFLQAYKQEKEQLLSKIKL